MWRSQLVVLLASLLLTVLVTAAPATAGRAAAPGAPEPTVVEWSAQHGTATASGTRWTEPTDLIFPRLVVRGELRNTGPGCSSVWVRWNRDLVPGPYTLEAEQCGAGSTAVDTGVAVYWPTTTGYLKVCRDSDQQDCGAATSLTSWPVE